MEAVLAYIALAATACPNGCSLRGTCEQNRCVCYPGFGGDDCATPLRCPNDCREQGMRSVKEHARSRQNGRPTPVLR